MLNESAAEPVAAAITVLAAVAVAVGATEAVLCIEDEPEIEDG